MMRPADTPFNAFPARHAAELSRMRGRAKAEEQRSSVMPFVVGGVLSYPCGRCGHVKPVQDFAMDATSPSGLQSWCRKCHAEDYSAKPEPRHAVLGDPGYNAALEASRRYLAENRDAINARRRARRAAKRR